jgi:ribonuclease-3
MQLGEIILLGKGEEQTGGRSRLSVLGSALEALVGAVYLAKGINATNRFVSRYIIEPAKEMILANSEDQADDDLIDYKSQLQEKVQKDYQEIPEYKIIRESGPDHNKSFMVEVMVKGEVFGRGYGQRKKSAENIAAKEALSQLGGNKSVE